MLNAENIKKIKARAKYLASEMTVEEKVFQLIYTSPAIERLGIEKYCWWNEALHGVARAGLATVFPQAIGLAATFDDEFIRECADIISTEARAKYNESQRKGDFTIYKGLTFWSPNVNIFRDPRWGRGHETYGEDPYLSSRIGVAFIRGLQGDDPRYLKAAACAKHFAVHSGPEKGRHGFDSIVSKRDMYETYLPAFRECINAGVESVMGAYNRLNGDPCCGNKELLTDILRDELGFDGHVVSDCGGIMIMHTTHHVTNTPHESAAKAINAGCDLNCGSAFMQLLPALDDGLTDEATITRSVERLMATRIKLGTVKLEEGEKCPYDDIPYSANYTYENRMKSLEAARRSLVLLKNDGLLPLSRDKKMRIAVIGPNADSKRTLEGNYNGTASHYVTPLRALVNLEDEDLAVIYAEGCHLFRDKVEGCAEPNDRIAEAVSAAESADIVLLCVGLDPTIEGEEGDAYNASASGDKFDLELPGLQNTVIDAVLAAGKPTIVLNMSGSAVNLSHAMGANAIIQAFYPGELGGVAITDLIFGKFSPAGRLPVTFYNSAEDLPPFTDYSMKGRTYRYFEGEAQYPFGYGLSYTSFEYGDIALDRADITDGESLVCTVNVTNTGKVDSDEVVQLYLSHDKEDAPICALRGFKRVRIDAGKTKTVTFELDSSAFELVSDEGKNYLAKGEATLLISPCAPVGRMKAAAKTAIVTVK